MLKPTLLLLTLALSIPTTTSDTTGCLLYMDNLYCAECDAENLYYFSAGGCLQSRDNICSAIDYLGRCIKCEQGYFLKNGQACALVSHIPGCLAYSPDAATTICQACGPSYILVENRCLKRVDNCDLYIPRTNICAKCAGGFTQAPDWCSCVAGRVSNCLQYDCMGLCVQCREALPRLSSKRDQCLAAVDFCMVHLGSKSGCRLCFDGFVLTGDSLKCLPEIQYCKLYLQSSVSDDFLKCAACLDKYFVSSDGTYCVGIIANCPQIDFVKEECVLCTPGYFPTDDNKKCLKAIEGCDHYDQSNTLSEFHKCCDCQLNFSLSRDGRFCTKLCPADQSLCPKTNQCVAVPICCEFSDLCGNCLSLRPSFTWCADPSNLLSSPGCASIPIECPNDFNSCGQCECADPAFSWCPATNRCVKIPECCEAHDNCGRCSSFKAGFTFCAATQACARIPAECPNDFGDCGECACKLAGFSWCPLSKACVRVPECCAAHNNCGQCTAIRAGFTWCAKGGACAVVPPECPGDHDDCGNCRCADVNFSWCAGLGACVRVPECCQTHDGCGRCGLLKPGFTWCPLSGRCVEIPAECPANYDDCGLCVCGLGFSWCAAQKKCVRVPECCDLHDNCGRCQTLKAGWSWCPATDKCQITPADCPSDHNNCGLCVCPNTSAWCASQKKCLEIPICCATHDNCGKCLTLRSGFTWCAASSSCASIPGECPGDYDECGQCRCGSPGYAWCPARRACVQTPTCCVTDDSCGNCLTFKPGWSRCPLTNSCQAIPEECPDNHDNCGVCTCPGGQSWCALQRACVQIPDCCASHDSCGHCIALRAGTSWCQLAGAGTGACAAIPAQCPGNHNTCGGCLCDSGFSWCAASGSCVLVPSCFERHDDCGQFVSLKAGTSWCLAEKRCAAVPAECPENHDGCGNCGCRAGETWCAAAGRCLAVPSCCATSDGCGNCVTLLPGTALCPATKLCANIPPECPNNHDGCGNCTCEDGFSWCPRLGQCVRVPGCCAAHDNCGACASLVPGTGWCAAFGGCYALPAACPLAGAHDCLTGECLCPAGQSWCRDSGACVAIPPCCASHDGCGVCTTFVSGTSWCPATGACYNIPGDCPYNHNCQTGQCVCESGFSWCASLKNCVQIPACCQTHNSCGTCVTFKPGTRLCPLTNACYSLPADCPLPASHDCQTGECLCGAGESWCPAARACSRIPLCCNAHDNCGRCLSLLPGTGFCAATQNCYSIPSICPTSHNCETGDCLCEAGFSWCAAQRLCVRTPSCCATHDNCGACLTFAPRTGFCALSKQCYEVPGDCPLPADHDCQTRECLCPAGRSWCLTSKACVVVPFCCNASDNCGTCLDFKIGTGFCAPTNSCYALPGDCPIPANHDCQTGLCVCPVGFSWCQARRACVQVPSCCLTHDFCGNCLTFNIGSGWCAETGGCYSVPANCPILHDCATGKCLCPEKQAYCESSKQCVDVPDCCAADDSCGNCLALKPNTVIVGGICWNKITIEFCEAYTQNFQVCTNCIATYILSADGLKCFPPIRHCNRYDVAASTADALTCLACEFPYSLSNNRCVIPRCVVENQLTPVLTCDQCLSNDSRSPAKTICYPPIEKCLRYSFREPAGYSCEECEFTYLPSQEKGLCLPAAYLLMGFNAAGAEGGADNGFYFALDVSRTLVWAAFAAEHQISGWSVYWYIQSYGNGQFYTIKTIISEFDPIFNMTAAKAYYIQSTLNGVSIQDGFSAQEGSGSNGSAVPTSNLQFSFERAFADNGRVWHIRSVSTGMYLTYGNELSNTPVAFFLKR